MKLLIVNKTCYYVESWQTYCWSLLTNSKKQNNFSLNTFKRKKMGAWSAMETLAQAHVKSCGRGQGDKNKRRLKKQTNTDTQDHTNGMIQKQKTIISTKPPHKSEEKLQEFVNIKSINLKKWNSLKQQNISMFMQNTLVYSVCVS